MVHMQQVMKALCLLNQNEDIDKIDVLLKVSLSKA